MRGASCLTVFGIVSLMFTIPHFGQDPKPGDFGDRSMVRGGSHVGTSPFHHPDADDTTFVADQGAGLDTGCTFRTGGPLEFTIDVDRVVGYVQTLRDHGLISEMAILRMPAFDVDFGGSVAGFSPERDRVFFNGRPVQTEFLTGSDNVWKENRFTIPVEWVNFPSDPGSGGEVQPAANTVRIDIDTANTDEVWCTAIDWAVLEIEVVRPVVMAHGIFSDGSVWQSVWVPRLNDLGVLTDNDLNMGALDSIQSNAGKIAAVVERAKRRWGVDRVNIVAHSKGGIDARHFAESSDSVDRIIQLGTPNAGSPLADLAQVGAILLTRNPRAVILINRLAGPAGIQLTRPYMLLYNITHGSNPRVEYTALAGDYDPDCRVFQLTCRPLERFLLAITGRGDTIVPITSVHALGFTNNRTFRSSGPNQDATHTALEHSNAVFGVTSDPARRFGRIETPHDVSGPLQPDSVTRTGTSGGSLQPGELATHTVALDQPGPAFISMFYSGGRAELVLISPSGQHIGPAVAGADPAIGFEVGEVPGGSAAVYSFEQPEVGTWTAEVTGISADDPPLPIDYAVHAWMENVAVTFLGALGQTSVSAGESIDLFGTLREEDAPLLDADVSARVASPDGSTSDVPLVDDGVGLDHTAGDGIYSGRLTDTSQSGLYRIVFTAAGSRESGVDFTREDFGLATVSASNSSFSGTFRDFGRDTDGDGFFNHLVIEVDLDLTTEADYRILGTLTDSEGNSHQAVFAATLPAGAATIELLFDGGSIFGNRVDGPYTLALVRLVEEAELALLPVAESLNAHETGQYSFEEFEHPAIHLTGIGSAQGVDLNGNGLFDLLEVTVEIGFDQPGSYDWSGLLTDIDGTELDFGSGQTVLSTSPGSLTFVFDGNAIGANGVDGPYFLSSLLVLGGGSSLVASTAFTTQPFSASQFEGFVAPTEVPGLTPIGMSILVLVLLTAGAIMLRRSS